MPACFRRRSERNMYTFNSRVRYSEIGNDENLSMFGVINYFQDCSTFQSESLGLGIDALCERHRAWLLNSWQIDVLRYPALGEEIEIGTFPYDFKGFFGLRNFFIKSCQGETLIKANSVWVYVNTDTGHPARVLPEEAVVYGMEPKLDMEYRDRRMKLPEKLSEFAAMETFPVKRYHIDTNHHVNNSYYPLMAWEYLPEGFRCGRLQIEYKTAAVFGDHIHPYVLERNGAYWVVLADKEQNPYAVIRTEEK